MKRKPDYNDSRQADRGRSRQNWQDDHWRGRGRGGGQPAPHSRPYDRPQHHQGWGHAPVPGPRTPGAHAWQPPSQRSEWSNVNDLPAPNRGYRGGGRPNGGHGGPHPTQGFQGRPRTHEGDQGLPSRGEPEAAPPAGSTMQQSSQLSTGEGVTAPLRRDPTTGNMTNAAPSPKKDPRTMSHDELMVHQVRILYTAAFWILDCPNHCLTTTPPPRC